MCTTVLHVVHIESAGAFHICDVCVMKHAVNKVHEWRTALTFHHAVSLQDKHQSDELHSKLTGARQGLMLTMHTRFACRASNEIFDVRLDAVLLHWEHVCIPLRGGTSRSIVECKAQKHMHDD